ncbi:tandem-95 repeat protein [Methylomicrobium lacus]|uniref:tandem-95 repeat protein n=1 Tax=Methylomicrobium lacus TaxID=136992 RepID=UPI00045EB5A3|nr:Ig-like domain-containing protein [Methylomicrobium lacus]
MPTFLKQNRKRTPVARKRILSSLVALLATSPLMADKYYVVTRTGGEIGNLKFANEDILQFDNSVGDNGEWSILFDGSDVGLSGQRIDGFYVADDYLLLSFAVSQKLDIGGQKIRIRNSDIVKFNWDTESGPGAAETKGAFELYFDGSDVGVKGNIDALTLDEEGNLIFSTNIRNKLLDKDSGQIFLARKQDLVKFIGSTGAETSGSFKLFFDGSKAGLTHSREDVEGAHLGGSYLYLTTQGKFNAGSATGKNEDILRCDFSSMLSLPIASCDNPVVVFKGADFGLARNRLNDIQVDLSIGIALSAFTVIENQPAATAVGNFTTVNAEAGDTFSYTLVAGDGDTDNGAFEIIDNQLRTTASFDFETKPNYSIRVRSAESGGRFVEKQFTVEVQDANDAPTAIALSSASVAENQPAGTAIGAFSSTDPDTGDTHSYMLVSGAGDTDNAAFQIVDNQLQTVAAFDFETKNSYSIRVRSADAGGLSVEQQLLIAVSNANDAPNDIRLSAAVAPEEQPAGTVVGVLSSTDIDAGDTHTYALVDGAGSTHNGLFQVVGNELRTAAALNSAQSPLSIRVRSTDAGALAFEKVLSVTVGMINHTPTFTKGAEPSLNEDAGAVVVPNWATAISDGDADAAQTLAFNITGNDHPELFSAGPMLSPDGELSFTPAPDAHGSATVTVTLSDDGGTQNGGQDTSAAQSFTITVNSVNDRPDFTAENPPAVNEDAGAQTIPNWVTAFSPGAINEAAQKANAYSVGQVSNPGLFSVLPSVAADGTLTYTPAANASGASTFEVAVQDDGGTDNGGVDTSQTRQFTVTVSAQDDVPVAVDDSVSVSEDAVATPLAVLDNDTDIDGGALAVASATQPTNGVVTLVGGNLSYQPKPDYCNSISGTPDTFTYTLTPGNSTATVSVSVLCVNDPPVASGISLSAASVPENQPVGTAIGDFSTLDPDTGDMHTYALVSGAGDMDNAAFQIVGNQLQTAAAFDFETKNSYSIRVRSTDADGLSVEQLLLIEVSDANDAPNDIQLSAAVAPEAQPAGTLVGVLSSADADALDMHTYALVDGAGNNDNALFQISGNELRTAAVLNSAQSPLSIRVRSTDAGALAFEKVLSVTVGMINHAPTFTKGAEPSVNEDAGAVVVSNWATAIDDADAGVTQALTFNITGNDHPELFSAGPAVSASGELSFTPAPDAHGSATVTLTLSDDGGTTNGGQDTSVAQSFTITVNSVNDRPDFNAANPPATGEDAGAQSVANWVTTFSPGAANEAAQKVGAYSVGQVSNPGLFSAPPSVAADGALTYTPATNAFGTSTFDVAVQDDGGTDNGGVDTSQTRQFTVTVNAVDDPPEAVADNVSVGEDAVATQLAVLGNDTDIDGGALDVASATQPANGVVSVVGGNLFYQPKLNYCNSISGTPDTFTYMLAPGNSAATVSVSVQCVNDPPLAESKTGIAVQANMKREGIDAALLTGVTDVDAGSNGCSPNFSVASIDQVSGGTVSNVNLAAGTFDFEPNVGFTGPATVNYTVKDDGCPGPAATSAAASITLDVSGPVIWFVNPALGSNGDGRLSTPFNSLASATAAKGASVNHRIFVYSGTTASNVGVSLAGDSAQATAQWLIGQGATNSPTNTFDALMGITPPVGTISRPAIGGTRPLLQGTLTLNGSNVRAQGFNLSTGGNIGINDATGAVSGVAVNEVSVASTNAGAVNLSNLDGTVSLTSVMSNGAVNGIVLNTVNTANGSFTVTGTGSAGSGGTIQNGATGISLTNSRNVSLAQMQLNGFSDFAIRGSSVMGFTLDNTVINGVNGDNAVADEGSVRFTELTGTATISNSNISGGFEDNFKVVNTSGTLDRLTFTNTTIGANSTSDGNDGIGIEAAGSSVVKVTVNSSTFTASRGDLFQMSVPGSGSGSDLVFTGNTLSNSQPAISTGGGGVTLGSGSTSVFTMNVSGNTFRDAVGHAVLIVKDIGAGSLSGTFANNTIGVAAVPNSGSREGSDLKVQTAGGGTMTMAITGNQFFQYNNDALLLQTGAGVVQGGNYNAIVTGNTMANAGNNAAIGFPVQGINLNGGITPGDNFQICAQIGGAGALKNDVDSAAGVFGGGDYRLRQRQSTTVRLPGYGGGATGTAAVVTFVNANNTVSGAGTATVNSPPGGGFVGGTACPSP